MSVYVPVYLKAGLEGGAHQLVMWSSAVQKSEVQIEAENVQHGRKHQQTHTTTHTLKKHTHLTQKQSKMCYSASGDAQCAFACVHSRRSHECH